MKSLTMPKKITYIDDNEILGIKYDYGLIKRNFDKLGIPDDFYNPTSAPLGQCKWYLNLSDRSSGKTTNWLLLGMIMYQMYGTQTQYIRNTEDDIAPKNSKDMFSVICEYDYIETITGGKYNHVFYKARRWYFCKVDEFGKIVDIDTTHFMFMCDVAHGEELKSSYNAPFGDFIIFDEFISQRTPCQFVNFCQVVKTIIRERRSPFIVMLSNTIDKHSLYFRELEIYNDVVQMKQGSKQLIVTNKGTKIYVELIGLQGERKRKRKILNELFFGFKNPKLASITGEGDWSLDNYQHIPESGNVEILVNNLYIEYNTKYVRLDIVKHETLDICVYVHWATYTYDDSIIFTIDDIYDGRKIYAFGNAPITKILGTLRKTRKFYFASNDVGSFLESYEREAGIMI